MSDSKTVGVSVKFPTTARKDPDVITIDEFNRLFELSGDKTKSAFIHKAIRCYVSEIQARLDQEQADLFERSKALQSLFPAKKD